MNHKPYSRFTLLALLAAGVAFAGDRKIELDTFHALTTISSPGESAVTCQGEDGTYTDVHVTGEGPTDSTDPRMSGTFHVDAYILTNPAGVGVSHDDWTVTDPKTGALKASGHAEALDVDPTYPIKSITWGQFADGSRFEALAVVTLPSGPGVPLTIEYGGPVTADMGRAVTFKGDCGGYFAHNQGFSALGFR